MSRLLGIQGTFFWTGLIFSIATAGFAYYFIQYYSWLIALMFAGFLLPTLIYFFAWFYRVRKNSKKADFKSAMRLNSLSSISFVSFFIFLYLSKYI